MCASRATFCASRRASRSATRGACRLRRAAGRIDLRALELAREVHVDGLPLAEGVERGAAGLAMAVPGRLHAAEGKLDLGADGPRVDVYDARLGVAHEL